MYLGLQEQLINKGSTTKRITILELLVQRKKRIFHKSINKKNQHLYKLKPGIYEAIDETSSLSLTKSKDKLQHESVSKRPGRDIMQLSQRSKFLFFLLIHFFCISERTGFFLGNTEFSAKN